jgi:hypothetical protein
MPPPHTALPGRGPDLADAHFNLAGFASARIAPEAVSTWRFSQAYWRPVTSGFAADRDRTTGPDDASGPRRQPDPVHRQRYTSAQPTPRLLSDLAAAVEHPTRVEFDLIFAGGASLKRHWNASIAQERLAKQSWNYVVLQEQSTLPVKNPGRYHENVRLFAPEIARRGAKTALYLTWSRQQAVNPTHHPRHREIAAEIDAWSSRRPCLARGHGKTHRHSLYDRQVIRLQPAHYLAACVFWSACSGSAAGIFRFRPAAARSGCRHGAARGGIGVCYPIVRASVNAELRGSCDDE